MFGISLPQLLIILLLVVLIFGSKRLGNLGSDVGKMIKGFKSSINDEEAETEEAKKLKAQEADNAQAAKKESSDTEVK